MVTGRRLIMGSRSTLNGLSGMEYSVVFSVPGVSHALLQCLSEGVSQSFFPSADVGWETCESI